MARLLQHGKAESVSLRLICQTVARSLKRDLPRLCSAAKNRRTIMGSDGNGMLTLFVGRFLANVAETFNGTGASRPPECNLNLLCARRRADSLSFGVTPAHNLL
jgi:hypothetical protein